MSNDLPLVPLPTRCDSITQCVLERVPENVFRAAKGPIPWHYVESRIKALNPNLSTQIVKSGWGGLCMTSLADAELRILDVRDPWTSVVHLLIRLRDIVAVRLPQYATIWSEVFGPFDSAKRRLYAPCTRYRGNREKYNDLRSAVLYEQGMTLLGERLPLDVLFSRSLCLQCNPQTPNYLETQRNVQEGRLICGTSDPWTDDRIDDSLFAVYDFPKTDDWPDPDEFEGVSEALLRTYFGATELVAGQCHALSWPRILLRDPGFWMLVFFEELVSHYTGSAGTGTTNKIWDAVQKASLSDILGGTTASMIIGHDLVYRGKFFTKSIYFFVRKQIDLNPRIFGDSIDITLMTLYLEKAFTMIVNATGHREGAVGIPSPSDTELAGSLNRLQGQGLPGIYGWSTESRNWGGVLRDVPQNADPLDQRTAADFTGALGDPDRAKEEAGKAGWAWWQIALAGLGVLGAIWWLGNRGSGAGQRSERNAAR